MQKRGNFLLLGGGEMQRANLGVEARIPVAAAIVILDDVFESREAAIVHVGRGARDLAKGGVLKLPAPAPVS